MTPPEPHAMLPVAPGRAIAVMMRGGSRRTVWKDPIVEETRSRREEFARRFNHDIKAIGEALRHQRKANGEKPFTRPPKRVKPTAA